MWQITWMLSLLPDWFWTLVLLTGVIGILVSWILKSISFVSVYRLPIQVISILMLLVGVYFQGVIANEEKYKSENDRLKKEIEQQNETSKKLNDELIKTQAERDAAISNKGKTVIKTIDRYIKGDPVEIVKEVVKEKNLSDDERKKLEAEIAELQKAEKQCQVPKLLINQHNSLTTKPAEESAK